VLSSEILAKVTITPFRINLKFMRSSPFAYLARAFLMSVSLLAKSWQCTKLLPTWRSVEMHKLLD